MARVAFLGLGRMGAPMAANLAKAHHVVGYDPAVETAAPSAVAAVSGADVVITMLPGGRQVLDVYAAVLAAAPPGTLFVDCSTIDVADAREAAALVVAAGHRAVDAPVSGGVAGAAAGTLTFMVGGDVEAARSVLEPMAGRIVPCGDHGAGQAAKICNNMMLGISMIGISEAFVLGEKLGLSNQAFYDVASTASGQCWALTANCPVPGPVPASPANHDYRPGFATALMDKDLGLAAGAVRANGVDGRLGLLAREIYRRFTEESGGELDFSAIVNDIRRRSGTEE